MAAIASMRPGDFSPGNAAGVTVTILTIIMLQ